MRESKVSFPLHSRGFLTPTLYGRGRFCKENPTEGKSLSVGFRYVNVIFYKSLSTTSSSSE